jgi:hypothetical protein
MLSLNHQNYNNSLMGPFLLQTAKTIGRLLQKNLSAARWNDKLNSELGQLRQKDTNILLALR